MKFAWEIADGMAHLNAAKVRFSGWSSSASHNVALFQVQTQPRTKSMLKRRTNGEQVKVLSLWVGKKHGVNLELRDKKYFY